MQIIQPTFLIEDHSNLTATIERAARKCYKSEDQMCPGSDEKLIRKLKNVFKHESVLEHGSISVTFVTDRGCCYDDQTEVMTKDGWKYFKDLNDRDIFATLHPKTGYLEYHKAEKLIAYPYKGVMLDFESSSIDLRVTPNHNMWVYDYDKRSEKTRGWKFLRADELVNNHYCFNKSALWDGVNIEEIVIPAHETKQHQFPEIRYTGNQINDFFELLGLWITDGSYHNSNSGGSCAIITQVKLVGVSRINELCSRLGLKVYWSGPSARIDNLRLMRYIENLFGKGPKTFRAYVPDIIKNASYQQITSFVLGVILGNGNVHKSNNHVVVYTASKKFADDLQEMFLKIGLAANIREVQPRPNHVICGIVTHPTAITWVVSVHGPRKMIHLLNKKNARKFAEKVEYDGTVYCATVPNHILYVRRNGKACWCGNSHEQVRHRLTAISQESTRYCVAGSMELNTTNTRTHMTIKELYQNKVSSANGAWKRILIRQMNEESGKLGYSKVNDIFFMGVKPTFRLKTKLGYMLECTDTHEIKTLDGYLKLKDLKVGGNVAVNGTALLYRNQDWLSHQYNTLMKTAVDIATEFSFNVSTIKKWVTIFKLPRKPLSYWNQGRSPWNKGMTESDDPRVKKQADALREFHWDEGRVQIDRANRVRKLSKSTYHKLVGNTCEVCGITTDKVNISRHHIDEDRENNVDENLIDVCNSCHFRIHSKNLEVAYYDKITSIEYIGEQEVYDISMDSPFKNFVANGVIVHNCNYGKDKFGSEIKVIDPYFFNPFDERVPVPIPYISVNEWEDQPVRLTEDLRVVNMNAFDVWLLSCLWAEWGYMTLTNIFKRKPQEARSVLPNSLKTELMVTANPREWLHILSMRTATNAHPQIRQIMVPLAKEFAKRWPCIFEAYEAVEHERPAKQVYPDVEE